MTFFEILSTLLIGPLKLAFEIIFVFANKFVGHYGLSIIILSLVMNFLLLPLYKRTDAIQEEARDTEEKLREGVAHIKKHFSGDERMMILQTYYRQNNYKPTDALNGSVSLLLEVPFFMAAYQFLSNLQLLEGVSLGPIGDLSRPDGLIILGSLTVNALPVIMTAVNLISSALYLKNFPLKTKIQLYAMALFFLVFLYNSPSGLVLYWTMNNLFSLGKTLFYKLKNPLKAIAFGATTAGLFAIGYALFVCSKSLKVRFVVTALGILLQLPMRWMLFGKKWDAKLSGTGLKPDRKVFRLGGLLLAILTGLLIPSTFIAASPQEYVDVTYYHNPLWYLVSSGSVAAGTFLVWFGVFYWLANDKVKTVLEELVWILCGVMAVNYMFFGTDLGVIYSNLQYENEMVFSMAEQAVNLLVIFAVAVVLFLISAKWNKVIPAVLLTVTIALSCMSVVNIVTISDSIGTLKIQSNAENSDEPHFELSTTGKNVIVIMLDRAMGEYVPHIMKERPELLEQFDGFTYYSNTISFGSCTNFGVPPLVGGYEYTPVEMNRRAEESLVSKHNEALKVMPILFLENGYDVTICDPPYANYQWIPDLSIYDDYPEINTYITEGIFSDEEYKEKQIQSLRRNFFCFSMMKAMPLQFQPTIYNGGRYIDTEVIRASATGQVCKSMSVAEGISPFFMNSYSVLEKLSTMTRISDGSTDTFMFLCNNATHEPMMLQEPDYIPASKVDNTEYDARNKDRFTVAGRTLIANNELRMIHYQTNMAVFIQLGKWFDYLRENGVYDNTRIILVSDHSWNMKHLEELDVETGTGSTKNVGQYFPLLMVKDFDSHEFTVSDEFMTNADVPTLAMTQLIENPVNPFTGKTINNAEKYTHDQMVIMSLEFDTEINNGNTFLPSMWASVKNNIWDASNWSFSEEENVLTEHRLP